MAIALEANAEDKVVVPHAVGDKWMIEGKLKFSGTYKTGGDITLKEEIEKILRQLGVNAIDWVDISGDSGGFLLTFNYETGKVMVRRTGAALKGQFEELPEEAYPAAITGASIRVMVLGS